jgi:hypothetical protein
MGSVAEGHPSRIRRGYGVPARAAQPPPANAAAAASRDQAAVLDPGDVRQPNGGDAPAPLGRLRHGQTQRGPVSGRVAMSLFSLFPLFFFLFTPSWPSSRSRKVAARRSFDELLHSLHNGRGADNVSRATTHLPLSFQCLARPALRPTLNFPCPAPNQPNQPEGAPPLPSLKQRLLAFLYRMAKADPVRHWGNPARGR